MELIITEKNDAASNIARLLADGKASSDKVYDTPVWRIKRGGEDCVIIGLRGHIMEVEFPEELVFGTRKGWQGITKDGAVVDAPDVPKGLDTPPWQGRSKRVFTPEGVNIKTWKIPSLPYLAFAPVIKEPKERGIIRSLRNLAKKADSVIIGTDFDREGELIGLDAFNIVRSENPSVPISRARYSAFIKKEIQEAFSPEKLVELDFDLAYAGESRQHIDLIWGAVLTRYLTVVKYSGAGTPRSVGRVQTPTLALVVEREKERERFVPEDYWDISARFAPQAGGEPFKAVHAGNRFFDGGKAQAAFAKVELAASGTVVSVGKKERSKNPPPPFNTTSLQAEAARIGIRPSRTMRIAESLYMSGLISYPRVDNTVYPDGLDHRALLGMLAGNPSYAPHANALLAKGKLTPTRGKDFSTDHPPIYPTGLATSDSLKAEEWKLYNLIARRYMATLSEAATIEKTEIAIDVAGEPFKASGDVIVVPGYRAIYQYGLKKDEQLPALAIGDTLAMSDPSLEAKQTKPEARYSSGSLIQEMERLGLGTKATRADMIEKLYDRKYVVNEPIEPTQLGRAVIEALEKYALTITTPDMTATLEKEMDQVADGSRSRDQVVLHSRELLADIVDELIPAKEGFAEMISAAVVADSRIGTCPKCGGDLCVKQSSKTRSTFAGCNNWPDCDVTYPVPQGRIEATDKVCQECGCPIVKVTPFRQKAQERCIDPACPSNQTPVIAVGDCPACASAGREGGKLMAQTNPRTMKRFLRCSNHPECECSGPLPQRGDIQVTGETCEACGYPMVDIVSGKGKPWRICTNMDCPTKEAEKKPARAGRSRKK